MIIDTHIHLNDPKYQDILDDVIKNSQKENVGKMFVIGYDYPSSIKALEIAKKYEFIYAIVGLHPSEVQKEQDKELTWLVNLLKEPKVIGIGEIGIDLYWDKTYKDLQIEYFLKQIDLAKKYNLPISVHSRDAIELTYQTLHNKGVKGIIHCYSGSLEMAQKFIKEGFYLGIGGVLTYKNSKLKDVIKEIPMSAIVTETDAPYLAPTPFRGQLNRPEYIKYVIEEISTIKNIAVIDVEKIVLENVEKMFGV